MKSCGLITNYAFRLCLSISLLFRVLISISLFNLFTLIINSSMDWHPKMCLFTFSALVSTAVAVEHEVEVGLLSALTTSWGWSVGGMAVSWLSMWIWCVTSASSATVERNRTSWWLSVLILSVWCNCSSTSGIEKWNLMLLLLMQMLLWGDSHDFSSFNDDMFDWRNEWMNESSYIWAGQVKWNENEMKWGAKRSKEKSSRYINGWSI